MPREAIDIKAGELWAYRSSTAGRFHQARILLIGEKHPPKIKILLVDDEWEGESRWVPRARLETPWSDVEAHRLRAQSEADLRKASNPPEAEAKAAETVFLQTIDIENVAWMPSARRGITEVYDVDAVAVAAGVDRELILAAPSFVDGDVLRVPWSTTSAIARGLAAAHAATIMRHVLEKEEIGRRESIFGVDVPAWVNGEERHLPGDIAASNFEKFVKPELSVLREWAKGGRAEEQNVSELQKELSRVGDIAVRAIAEVRRLRSNRSADALTAELLDPLSAFERQTGRLTPDERGQILASSSGYRWSYHPADTDAANAPD